MFDLKKLRGLKGNSYYFHEKPVIDGEFVKNLRKKLGFSQSLFASLMNVSNKTVEKWEQGANPVSNGNAIAMILFDKQPDLVNLFIEREVPEMEYDYKKLTDVSDLNLYSVSSDLVKVLFKSNKTQSCISNKIFS